MNDVRAAHSITLESPSELYHEASKLRESDRAMARTVLLVNNSPQVRQTIANPSTSHRGFPTLTLPTDFIPPNRPLNEVLLGRRSTRTFSSEALSLQDLSAILFLSAAVSNETVDSFGISWGLRCSPSGGGLYPIDIYCVALNVTGADDGLYSYDPKTHALQLLKKGSYVDQLAGATYLSESISAASICFLMVANFPRSKFKYGERGYRFVLLEAGHLAQNMLLVAGCSGHGALPLGGYVDDQINDLVGVDGCDQAVVYGVLVGSVAGCTGG